MILNEDVSSSCDVRCDRIDLSVGNAAQKARHDRDWKTWVDCLTPSAQDEQIQTMIAFTMLDPAAQIPSIPQPVLSRLATTEPATTPDQQLAALEAHKLLLKHGVKDTDRSTGESDEDFTKKIIKQIDDEHACLIDVMSATPKHDAIADSKPMFTNMKIDGGSAAGELIAKEKDGGTTSTPVEFKMIDGSWRISSIGNL